LQHLFLRIFHTVIPSQKNVANVVNINVQQSQKILWNYLEPLIHYYQETMGAIFLARPVYVSPTRRLSLTNW